MIPGQEEQMKKAMNEATPADLYPGFDKEQEWDQLAATLHARPQLLPWHWRSAAAILVLAVSGWLAYYLLHDNKEQDVSISSVTVDTPARGHTPIVLPIQPATDTHSIVTTSKPSRRRERQTVLASEIITNGTPCPIEIRISQTIKCPDSKPSAISTKSTMEPGQTAQLDYQPHDSVARNCSLTVKEIAITSIATGETIVLNSRSAPSTAQEVFSYITGQKQGDILAGMFATDCNHHKKKRSVRLGNRDGNLTLQ